MTNKQKIKLWATDRQALGYDLDSDILNLTYRVIKNYCRHIDIDDIGGIYENLWINCEMITSDTLDDFSVATVERLTRHKLDYVKKQLNDGYFFLLNFYAFQNGCLQRFDGCIRFKTGYDYINKQ